MAKSQPLRWCSDGSGGSLCFCEMALTLCHGSAGRMLPRAGSAHRMGRGKGVLRPGRTYRPDSSQGAFIKNLFGRSNSSEMVNPVGRTTDLGDGKLGEGVDGGFAVDAKRGVEDWELPGKVSAELRKGAEMEGLKPFEDVKDSESTGAAKKDIGVMNGSGNGGVKEELDGENEKIKAGVIEEEEDPFGLEELFKEVTEPEQLGKRGEIWVIAQFLSLIMILVPPLKLTGLIAALGWITLLSGVLSVSAGVIALGRSLSPLPYPRASATLVTKGIYALVRHPIYGGLIMASFGLALITGSELRGILSGILWFLLESKIKVEEKALESRFPEYSEYKVGVQKLFPFFY